MSYLKKEPKRVFARSKIPVNINHFHENQNEKVNLGGLKIFENRMKKITSRNFNIDSEKRENKEMSISRKNYSKSSPKISKIKNMNTLDLSQKNLKDKLNNNIPEYIHKQQNHFEQNCFPCFDKQHDKFTQNSVYKNAQNNLKDTFYNRSNFLYDIEEERYAEINDFCNSDEGISSFEEGQSEIFDSISSCEYNFSTNQYLKDDAGLDVDNKIVHIGKVTDINSKSFENKNKNFAPINFNKSLNIREDKNFKSDKILQQSYTQDFKVRKFSEPSSEDSIDSIDGLVSNIEDLSENNDLVNHSENLFMNNEIPVNNSENLFNNSEILVNNSKNLVNDGQDLVNNSVKVIESNLKAGTEILFSKTNDLDSDVDMKMIEIKHDSLEAKNVALDSKNLNLLEIFQKSKVLRKQLKSYEDISMKLKNEQVVSKMAVINYRYGNYLVKVYSNKNNGIESLEILGRVGVSGAVSHAPSMDVEKPRPPGLPDPGIKSESLENGENIRISGLSDYDSFKNSEKRRFSEVSDSDYKFEPKKTEKIRFFDAESMQNSENFDDRQFIEEFVDEDYQWLLDYEFRESYTRDCLGSSKDGLQNRVSVLQQDDKDINVGSYERISKTIDASLAHIDIDEFRSEDIHQLFTLPNMCADIQDSDCLIENSSAALQTSGFKNNRAKSPHDQIVLQQHLKQQEMEHSRKACKLERNVGNSGKTDSFDENAESSRKIDSFCVEQNFEGRKIDSFEQDNENRMKNLNNSRKNVNSYRQNIENYKNSILHAQNCNSNENVSTQNLKNFQNSIDENFNSGEHLNTDQSNSKLKESTENTDNFLTLQNQPISSQNQSLSSQNQEDLLTLSTQSRDLSLTQSRDLSLYRSGPLFSPFKEPNNVPPSYSVDSLDTESMHGDLILTCRANKNNYTIAFEGSYIQYSDESEIRDNGISTSNGTESWSSEKIKLPSDEDQNMSSSEQVQTNWPSSDKAQTNWSSSDQFQTKCSKSNQINSSANSDQPYTTWSRMSQRSQCKSTESSGSKDNSTSTTATSMERAPVPLVNNCLVESLNKKKENETSRSLKREIKSSNIPKSASQCVKVYDLQHSSRAGNMNNCKSVDSNNFSLMRRFMKQKNSWASGLGGSGHGGLLSGSSSLTNPSSENQSFGNESSSDWPMNSQSEHDMEVSSSPVHKTNGHFIRGGNRHVQNSINNNDKPKNFVELKTLEKAEKLNNNIEIGIESAPTGNRKNIEIENRNRNFSDTKENLIDTVDNKSLGYLVTNLDRTETYDIKNLNKVQPKIPGNLEKFQSNNLPSTPKKMANEINKNLELRMKSTEEERLSEKSIRATVPLLKKDQVLKPNQKVSTTVNTTGHVNKKDVYVYYPNYALPDLGFLSENKLNMDTRVFLVPQHYTQKGLERQSRGPRIAKRPFSCGDLEKMKKAGFPHVKDWDSLNFLLPKELKELLFEETDCTEVHKPSFLSRPEVDYVKSNISSNSTHPSSGYRGSSTILNDSDENYANINEYLAANYKYPVQNHEYSAGNHKYPVRNPENPLGNQESSIESLPKGILRKCSSINTKKISKKSEQSSKRRSLQEPLKEGVKEVPHSNSQPCVMSCSCCYEFCTGFCSKGLKKRNLLMVNELPDISSHEELCDNDLNRIKSRVSEFISNKNQFSPDKNKIFNDTNHFYSDKNRLSTDKNQYFTEKSQKTQSEFEKNYRSSPDIHLADDRLSAERKSVSFEQKKRQNFNVYGKKDYQFRRKSLATPEEEFPPMLFDAQDKKTLVLSVRNAVEKLLRYFNRATTQQHKIKLGKSAQSPEVAQIVLEKLCSAIYALLSDGLLPCLHSLFGRINNSVWRVVEATSQIGPSTKALNDLVLTLNSEECLTEGPIKFNAFIFGLLNIRSLDGWLGYLRTRESTLQKHYHPEAFLYLSNTAMRGLYDDLLNALRPLTLLPFRLDILHEYKALHASLMKMEQRLLKHSTGTSPLHGLKSPTKNEANYSSKRSKMQKHNSQWSNSNFNSNASNFSQKVSNSSKVALRRPKSGLEERDRSPRPRSCHENSPVINTPNNLAAHMKKRWSGVQLGSKLASALDKLMIEEAADSTDYSDSLDTPRSPRKIKNDRGGRDTYLKTGNYLSNRENYPSNGDNRDNSLSDVNVMRLSDISQCSATYKDTDTEKIVASPRKKVSEGERFRRLQQKWEAMTGYSMETVEKKRLPDFVGDCSELPKSKIPRPVSITSPSQTFKAFDISRDKKSPHGKYEKRSPIDRPPLLPNKMNPRKSLKDQNPPIISTQGNRVPKSKISPGSKPVGEFSEAISSLPASRASSVPGKKNPRSTIEKQEMCGKRESSARSSSQTCMNTKMEGFRFVQTLQHRMASDNGHLSFNRGDILTLILDVDEKFILCCNKDRKGLVPREDVIAYK